MSRWSLGFVGVSVLFALPFLTSAQAPSAPSFEVASIKLNKANVGPKGIRTFLVLPPYQRLHAQDAPAPVARVFEVASVKQNVSGDSRSGTHNTPGRVTITNEPIRELVQSAYGSNDLDVLGGPDWVDTARWDIAAVAPPGDGDAPW